MNILVDGRTWSNYGAGVSTFFTCAILEWARQKQQDTFYIILPKGLDPRVELNTPYKNIILLNYAKIRLKKIPNIFILQVLVPYLCNKLKIDLYYSPVPHLPFFIPSRTKKMVTIHDVVNLEMSETMSWTNRLATSYFFGKAVKTADFLWTNSHYTKSKVEEYFPHRLSHDIFVGDAADESLYYPRDFSFEQKETIRKKYGVKGPFILFVGSLEPRKNLRFLLELMPNLYQKHRIQLVVVGGKGWKNSDIRKTIESPLFPQESTIFCGYVSNQELTELYNTADCFVSAALMEGFGMPQLEALKCGCPIVTAHNTAMIEIASGKDGAVTIEGYNHQNWEEMIVRTIQERPSVVQDQLKEYNWGKIIRNLTTKLDTLR